MNELINQHLDLWTSAIASKSSAGRGTSNKQTAYGIKKLRELILELAVRGKLVSQDPNDEPAIVLLEKIKSEQKQLIKEGKIKKIESFPDISAGEITLELPSGWELVRLGNISNKIGSGSTPRGGSNVYVGSGIPFLRSQNIWNYGLELSDVAYVPEDTHRAMANTAVLPNDILLNITGASLGRCTIFPEGVGEANVSQHVTIIRTSVKEIVSYLHICILSPYLQSLIWDRQVGMAREGLSKKVLELFEIPLPPLAEQNRIVAKVDELMALCDQLEQEQTDSMAAHKTLVQTLLGTLTQAADAAEFEQAWSRIADHFDNLFTTEPSIDQLKQTLLQLAVMGKLVPQDPNDEPARAFLEKTCSNRGQLVDKNKLNEGNLLSPIGNPELPIGWAWLSFGDLGQTIGGGTPSKSNPNFWDGNIPWISPKDMKVDFISESIDAISQEAIEGSAVKLIPSGSLLLVVRGMILAHSFPVAITRVPVTINQDMKAVVINGFDEGYVLLMMKALKMKFIDLVDRSTHGTCKLVSEKLWSKKLPIPPLAEQHRIVAKVDELMALCDALKARIAAAQTTQIHLADTIVEQAVA